MVYLIRQENTFFYKIGYTSSTSAKGRLSSMQTGNPFKLHLVKEVKGNPYIEKHLHGVFSKLRVRGEWYRFDYKDLKKVHIAFDNIKEQQKKYEKKQLKVEIEKEKQRIIELKRTQKIKEESKKIVKKVLRTMKTKTKEELEQREWFFHLIRMENDKKYKEEIYNS